MSSNLKEQKSKIDLFLAGPPCEGNSNLNNKTRRRSEKQSFLIYLMLQFH